MDSLINTSKLGTLAQTRAKPGCARFHGRFHGTLNPFFFATAVDPEEGEGCVTGRGTLGQATTEARDRDTRGMTTSCSHTTAVPP